MVKEVSDRASKWSDAFLDYYDMRKVKEAVRTVPHLFEYYHQSQTDSPATRKTAAFQITMEHAKVTLKEAWVIADAFWDLVTDKEFLAKVENLEKRS